jgi:transposase
MSFLCEMESVKRFRDTDHLAVYVGLVPPCHNSGEVKSRGEITSRAHKLLRDMIVESARTAARRDPALQMAFALAVRKDAAQQGHHSHCTQSAEQNLLCVENKKRICMWNG